MSEKHNKYLVVKGSAGLGNRILCYLSAVLYALLSDRQLFVDWRDPAYSDNESNSFSHYFSVIPPCISDLHTLPGMSTRPKIWMNRLDLSLKDILNLEYPDQVRYDPSLHKRLSICPAQIHYQEDSLVMFSYSEQIQAMRKHLQGPLASLKTQDNHHILKYLAKHYLHPSVSLRDEIRSHITKLLSGNTIGIHVRYTDRCCRLHKLEKRLEHLCKQYPEATIFLATDSIKVENKLQTQYGSRLSTHQKWYPEDGHALHLNSQNPNHQETGWHALIELYILAACQHLIYDESSTFGYVASLLSEIPEAQQTNVSPLRFLPRWLRHDLWNIQKTATVRLQNLWYR